MDLTLPDCYLITPEPDGRVGRAESASIPDTGERIDIDTDAAAQAAFLTRLSDALSHRDIRLVQLRAKRATPAAYASLAQQALALCHAHRARLILNGPASGSASIADADGIHLSSAALMACRARPLAAGKLVSAACHSVEQLLHARRIGVDLVTLSPVLATLSHPDVAPLGWQRLADMIETIGTIDITDSLLSTERNSASAAAASRSTSTSTPWTSTSAPSTCRCGPRTPAIYALGGMTREHIAQAKACGAHGIAAIRGLW